MRNCASLRNQTMEIVEIYSHLNGHEFLLVHNPRLWAEIETVITKVDAVRCRTKVSKEKRMKGQLKFSPRAMNAEFCRLLAKSHWNQSRVSYWVTRSEKLIRQTMTKPAAEQRAEIIEAGEEPIFTFNQLISSRVVSRSKCSSVNILSLHTIYS